MTARDVYTNIIRRKQAEDVASQETSVEEVKEEVVEPVKEAPKDVEPKKKILRRIRRK